MFENWTYKLIFGAKMKIERKILLLLIKLEVAKRKIAELFEISRTTLYEYLKNNPIQENELNAISIDRDILIGLFWKYLIENQSNTVFRQPENNIAKKKIKTTGDKISNIDNKELNQSDNLSPLEKLIMEKEQEEKLLVRR